jgi:predicted TPR repeat methyltransferase
MKFMSHGKRDGGTEMEETLSLREAVALAVGLQREGRLAEAEEIYREILRATPEQPDALHFLGVLCHQLGRNAEAITLLRQAVARAPDYADAYNNLGNILKLEGCLAEAREAFQTVIKLKPGQAAGYNNLGVVLKEQGNLAEAIEVYDRALALEPDNADAHYNRGNALEGEKNQVEAERAWRRAVTLQPGHAEAWFQLGNLFRDQGRTEEALAAFGETARLNARHAAAHCELGTLLLKQGAAAAAVEAYRRAVASDPACENARHYLAAILEVLGRKEEAVAVWRDWLEQCPEHPVPRHMLAAASGQNPPDRAGDDFIRKTFDGFADKFETHLKNLDYRAPDLVAAALAGEFESARGILEVLDAGCGTGWCGPLLRPYAARLVGVDLSAGMLDKARQGRGYDELVEAELTEYLGRHSDRYDLIVSADTLVYFGDLNDVMRGVSRSLKPGGCLIFTVEEMNEAEPAESGFRLHSRGRYSHGQTYVGACLDRAGLKTRSVKRADLRLEAGEPVNGLVVTARKP